MEGLWESLDNDVGMSTILKVSTYFFFLFICAGSLSANEQHERARLALSLHDTSMASVIIEQLYAADPKDTHTLQLLFRYLSQTKDLEAMRQLWVKIDQNKIQLPSETLEHIAWTVIATSARANHPRIRAEALFSAAGTQDVRAVSLLLSFLFDPHEYIQELALQVAERYPDAPVQARAVELTQSAFPKIKIAAARLLVAQKAASACSVLQQMLTDENLSEEDRVEVATLLAQISEKVDSEFVHQCIHDQRPAVRILAATCASRMPSAESTSMMLPLLDDPSIGVRRQAMVSIGLWKDLLSQEEQKFVAERSFSLLHSPSRDVAATAAWLLCLSTEAKEQEEGATFLLSLIRGSAEQARLACSKIVCLGMRGVELAHRAIPQTTDPLCQMNLSAFLLRHRAYVQEAAKMLKSALSAYPSLLEGDEEVLWIGPSKIAHHPAIPRLPESQDLLIRLQLTSLQCYAGEPVEKQNIEKVLSDRAWGSTVAAAGLIFSEFSSSLDEVLTPLLSHEIEIVRVQAALLLATIGKSHKAANILWEQFEVASKEGKEALLLGFGSLPPEQVSKKLVPLLFDSSPIIRTRAAGALLASLYH